MNNILAALSVKHDEIDDLIYVLLMFRYLDST